MLLRGARDFLLPGLTGREKRFEQELRTGVRAGLYVLGWMEFSLPLLMAAGLQIRMATAVAPCAAGVLLLLMARTPGIVKHWAWLAPASIAAWAGALIVAQPTTLLWTGFLLVAAAAILPFAPLVMLGLGLLIEGISFAGSPFAQQVAFIAPMLLSAVVTGLLYAQRYAQFHAHAEELKACEILSTAQLRALLSENAVAVGKLAAAVTHEINTPLGALRSSIDTLLVMAGKIANATPAERPRLARLEADLRRSIAQSAERLQNVVLRLRRFIDLEGSDLQPVNVNDVLNNVAILFEPQVQGRVELKLDLQPVVEITARPQQLSTVFSSLLSNAINAVNGSGCIRISTEQKTTSILVRIQDNGRGMKPEELENIFDPSFKVVAGGRVSTGNWSLFNSRQIVFEHGGEILIDSAEGEGTTVCVKLPC